MGIFAAQGRCSRAAVPDTSRSRNPGQRKGLPHRCEAVADALVSGSSAVEACAVAGQELARDGASLDEALHRLRETWQLVRRADPDFEAVRALSNAWSDTTLGYLHQASCEDPLTGLASQAHLRSAISELHRAAASRDQAERPNVTHALVVCELPAEIDPSDDGVDHFTRAMRLTQLGEVARTVFAHGNTVARVGPVRVVVLVDRESRLGRRVRLLRQMVAGVAPERGNVRVWIEGLPSTDLAAAALLDELARP